MTILWNSCWENVDVKINPASLSARVSCSPRIKKKTTVRDRVSSLVTKSHNYSHTTIMSNITSHSSTFNLKVKVNILGF